MMNETEVLEMTTACAPSAPTPEQDIIARGHFYIAHQAADVELADVLIVEMIEEIERLRTKIEVYKAADYEALTGATAAEVVQMRTLLQEARDHIGSMPTLGGNGEDRFFPTLRLVTKIEAALGITDSAPSTDADGNR